MFVQKVQRIISTELSFSLLFLLTISPSLEKWCCCHVLASLKKFEYNASCVLFSSGKVGFCQVLNFNSSIILVFWWAAPLWSTIERIERMSTFTALYNITNVFFLLLHFRCLRSVWIFWEKWLFPLICIDSWCSAWTCRGGVVVFCQFCKCLWKPACGLSRITFNNVTII